MTRSSEHTPEILRQGEVTTLLRRISDGDQSAFGPLWELVHEEVRRMARGLLTGESGGGAAADLQATALVSEVFLRLHGGEQIPSLENRRHFFGAAATTLRRILIDHARTRRRLKRGGGARPTALEFVAGELSAAGLEEFEPDMLEAAIAAMDALAAEHPRAAEVARLRYLLGLDPVTVASLLDISDRTVRSDWVFARAWLKRRLAN
jgi:RNA polymerase sigma-70 factor (ECF subfamily)